MPHHSLRARSMTRVLTTSSLLVALSACSEPADDAAPEGDADMGAATMDMSAAPDASEDAADMAGAQAPDAGAEDMAQAADLGGEDMGEALDMAPPPDGASKATHCAQLSQELRAAGGAVIEVSPGPPGKVLVGGQEMTLRQAVSQAGPGDTVALADGTYTFPANEGGGYTGVYITTPDVTLRSASGDPDAVIIDSNYADHGNGSAPITIAAPGVTVADLTVKRSVYHLVHLWADGDQATLHNLRLIDGGQQFVKSSARDDTIDDVRITCSNFEMTDAGRDNVWGYGAQDGNTTCYTGGIDSHEGQGWFIADNTFRGIYCDASGVARPAHGVDPDARGGQTYQGGLAEHAIHLWDSPEGGGGHVIARNLIIDCARGIGLGFRAEVYDITVRDNMISSRFAGSREHDVGISMERARDSAVLHNTVFFSHPDAYPNAIEYRWESTSNLRVANNLTGGRIHARNGATATLEGNVTGADASWFVDAAGGDLHLASCDLPDVAGQAADVGEAMADFDHDARAGAADVGADQCAAP